jgi:hypothetical protein
MKGTLRRLVSLGVVWSAVIGAIAAVPKVAFALTNEEIVQKLSSVPVFVIVDSEGRSLTASIETGSTEVQVPVVFIDGGDAQSFLDGPTGQSAGLAAGAQVGVVSLGDVYEEAQDQLTDDSGIVYIPAQEAVAAAAAIAQTNNIQGVPLFAAVNVDSGQYLLYGDNTLPVFFSLEDLRAQIDLYIAANPTLRSSIGVEVVTLEGLIQSMEQSNPELDEFLELIRLVPSSETVRFLQSRGRSTGRSTR